MTVVFADLSGYTAVAERMDPESVKSLVDRSLQRLGEEVDRFGGRVDKYIGDNVMAVFGAPVAHEDDAERAVRAALGMQDAMAEINERLGATHGVNLALRVGVNTGEVVAGAVGDGYTVIGDTVNVAARLQSAANPGSVTVGERTFRATRQGIEYQELEPLTLKGKAEPVPAWEAVGLTTAQPARRVSLGRTPLVGRTDKLDLLRSIYERAERERKPHLVTVMGQAGVGKSRLRHELERCLGERHPPPTFREGRCLPYGSGIVYWALGEVIRAEAGIVDGDTGEQAWEKLLATVDGLMTFSSSRAGRAARAAGGRDRPPARHRGAAGGRPAGGRGPAAHARELLLRRAIRDRGHGAPQPADPRVRGHPLGRPRDARPDRVPGAVGAGDRWCCCALRATSCSTAARAGAAGATRRRRSCSSR